MYVPLYLFYLLHIGAVYPYMNSFFERLIKQTILFIEYRLYIEKDAALERRFQSVMVGEPSPEEAVQILMGLRDKYEAHHKLKINEGTLPIAYIGMLHKFCSIVVSITAE